MSYNELFGDIHISPFTVITAGGLDFWGGQNGGSPKIQVWNGSNHGPGLIWAGADAGNSGDLPIKLPNGELSKVSRSGTSAAGPFLGGIVALMKSRNPDLTPIQIKQILRETATKVRHEDIEPTLRQKGASQSLFYEYNILGGIPMVNAQAAVEKAIQMRATLNDPNAFLPKSYAGVVQGGGSSPLVLRSNQESRQILISSVSQESVLVSGRAVNIQGWTNIPAGKNLLDTEIEVLKVSPAGLPNATNLQITQGPFTVTSIDRSKAFNVKVNGQNLLGKLEGSQQLQMKLIFQSTDSPNPHEEIMASATPNNEGSEVSFQVNQQTANKLINGKQYKVFVEGQAGRGLASTQNFSISNTSGGGGVSVYDGITTPADLPQNNYVYDQVGNRWMRPGFRIQVDANEYAGIRFTQPIRDLEVKIGPVLVPITSILNDLAVIGIPENLPIGVHDVVIKASGQTLTLEQAVEKVSQAIPPTPEPTAPPSGNPGEYESVRVFNIEGNDEGRVYLNDQLILTAHAGEDNYAYLGEYGSYPLRKDQRNEFRFELVNNGGGYTYGFELRAQYNGTAAYRDIQGSPGLQNKVWPDGSEDQRQGIVYNERMITNSKFSPVGSGPFWMKVFNLNPDESLTIQTYNDTNDIQWPDGVFRVGPPINSQEISKKFPIQPFDPFSSCGLYDPNFECWNPRYIGFSFENPTGPYNIGIEVYKGINLVYRNIQGQRGVWGAEENQEGSSNPYIQDYVAHQYRHYPAGY